MFSKRELRNNDTARGPGGDMVVPEPGMPDTAIRRRLDLGTSWNFSQVFSTKRSTCSSIFLPYEGPGLLCFLLIYRFVKLIVLKVDEVGVKSKVEHDHLRILDVDL
jgi:hypothetical protein